MGYRMEYGSWNENAVYKRYKGEDKKYVLLLLIPVLIICCLYKEQIIRFILPGDPDTTKYAINTFISDIKEGERVTDAFSSFCKVILDDASIS